MPIRYKIHHHGADTVLAAADHSALGKKHVDEPNLGASGAPAAAPHALASSPPRRVLDLAMFRSFYDGESIDEASLARLLSTCTSANLVGEKAVAAALAAGLAQPHHVVRIGRVPHLQLYRIEKEHSE